MKALSIFITLMLVTASLFSLTLLTEQYPPFNYEENGELKGITVDIMDEILKKIDNGMTKEDIKLYNWTRAFSMTEENKDYVLFAMTLTDERKPKFKWVGPIIPTKQVLIAKKSSNIKINGANDINKYKVGVIRDDVGHQLLKALGVNDSAYDFAPNPTANVKKLSMGRIDLMVYEEAVVAWEMKANNINNADYETVYTLKEGQLYFAFNKDTDDALVQKFQKAFDELKKDGTVDKIIQKYLK